MFGGISRLLYIGINRWQSVLLVGVLMVVIGAGIAIVSEVPMQEETDLSSRGTISVEQSHYSRASENASVYRPGEMLHEKSLYLFTETPNVTVQETIRTEDGPSATVDVQTRLVYRIQYADSVVYRERGPSSHKNGTISEGNLSVKTDYNISKVDGELQKLRDEFGSESDTQAILVTRVEYNSQSSSVLVSRTPISFTSKGYHIPTTTEREQYGEKEVSRKPVPGRTMSIDGILLGRAQLLGLLLAVVGLSITGTGLGYLRRVPEADKEELYQKVIHQRYGELIATVELGECPAVDREMESLQDLVFIGEDGGEPILYFPTENRYIVQCNGVIYGYRFII